MEHENRTRWDTSVSLDLAMSLADESANKPLCSLQLYVQIVNFLKFMRGVLKHVPLERWIQHMIDGFKTVSLAWVNKIAMIGYTWLFVYESAVRYEWRQLGIERSHFCLSYDRYTMAHTYLCSISIKANHGSNTPYLGPSQRYTGVATRKLDHLLESNGLNEVRTL